MSEWKDDDPWDSTFEAARKQLRVWALAATPAQRLAWLEDALELAWRSGALERGRRARGTWIEE